MAGERLSLASGANIKLSLGILCEAHKPNVANLNQVDWKLSHLQKKKPPKNNKTESCLLQAENRGGTEASNGDPRQSLFECCHQNNSASTVSNLESSTLIKILGEKK